MLTNPATICAIARNEGRYIEEWIRFHRAIGFSGIVLYDNASTDDTADIARRFCDFVTVVDWPSFGHTNPQLAAYGDFLKRFASSAEWMMCLDLDEFVNLKRHGSIGAFLADMGDAAATGINWRMFGDSGALAYEPRPVAERFTMAAPRDFGPNHLIKVIARTAAVKVPAIHSPQLHDGCVLVSPSGRPLKPHPAVRQDVVEHDIAQINHYFVKSAGEWQIKLERGRADLPSNHHMRLRNAEEFALNNRNDERDVSIQRFIWT